MRIASVNKTVQGIYDFMFLSPLGGCPSSEVVDDDTTVGGDDDDISGDDDTTAVDDDTGDDDTTVADDDSAGDDDTTPCDDGDPSSSLQIAWLRSQIGLNGLVDSYKDDGTDKAYTYDQAISIIAFTHAGEVCEAQQVVDTVASLQEADGALYTCYSTVDGSVCENWQHSGPTAWIVNALNYYETNTGDSVYWDVAEEALSWLDTMQDTNINNESYGAISYGTGYPADMFSTEHNLSADSAYYNYGILDEDDSYIDKAILIEDYLLAEMWGYSPESDGPYEIGVLWRGYEDYAWCTDAQSWGVLDLGATGPSGEPLSEALDWLTSGGYGYGSTLNVQEYTGIDVEGFSFCTEDVNPPNGQNYNFCGTLFVWTEGTLGVAAALREAGESELADYYFAQIGQTVSVDGGVPYSFSTASLSYPCNWPYESVAGTAWYYFYDNGINPFWP